MYSFARMCRLVGMCKLANILGTLMPLDIHQNRETVAINAEGPSLVLCELMLQVLGRDNALRRAYVQRRWQALLPNRPGAPGQSGAERAELGTIPGYRQGL